MLNDFTKEELEDLLYCVKDHTGYQGDSIHENLIDKIQSMIDNYKCTHESDGLIYTSLPPQNKCKKCGEFYR